MRKKNIPLAKVTRPKVTGVFPRERLFRLMDTGRNCPVLWITSPPGAGKTTLVASYLDARKLPCLWYQADEGDVDIATFFYYMGMAAEKAIPNKRKPSLPLLTPEYRHTISAFTRNYFELLYSSLRPPFTIVFDNYQDVPANAAFHEMFAQCLDIIPEGINIAVISRTEPPAPLARLCANNKCYHIRWDDIKFNPDEFRHIIRSKMPEGLSDEAITRLYEKTEGWAAGLVLIMEGLKNRDVDYATLRTVTPGMVFDYFANEVLMKTDKETQTFLLKTSVLPAMTASMAEALTGMGAAGHILSLMNRNNYFTAARHQPERVYQYHPLFREFLFSRAKDTFTHKEFLAIQKHAAVILEEAGHSEAAAIIFRDILDWDSLTGLILKHAEFLIEQGRFKTLEEWLISIPGETMENTPWLLYWYGICHMPYNPTESRNCFDRAFELFRSQEEQTGMWLSWSYAVDTFFHEFSDFSPLDRYISAFEEFYREGCLFTTPEVGFRVVSYRFICMMLRTQYHPEIGKWAGRTLLLLPQCREVNLRLVSGYYLAIHYMWVGDFTNAGMVVTMINEGIQPETIPPLERILWETTKAMYAWLTGDIASCLRIVSNALKLAGETGVHIWDHHLLSHGACASLSAGDVETASDLLRKIEPGLAHTRKIEIGFYHFLCAWKELICGNVPAAAEHIKISVDAVVEVDTYLPIAVARVAVSQVFAAMGKNEESLNQLKLAWQIGLRAKSNHIKFMCLLTEAHFAIDYGIIMGNGESAGRHGQTCLSTRNDNEEAGKYGLKILRDAMSLGREHGIVNCFGWRPDVMPRLCVHALDAGIEVSYVQRLIRTRHLVPVTPPLGCENWPWPLRICTLGRFAILRDEAPIHSGGKVQHKPMELLKAIISFGGKDVPRDTIIDILWPNAEGDMARQSFDTTLHRLRRLIGNDKAISLQGEQVSLDAGYCWVDVWAFEHLYQKAEDIFKGNGERERGGKGEISDTISLPHAPHLPCTPAPMPTAQTEILPLSQKAIALYKGQYLPSDTRCVWTVSTRERLRNKFHNLVIMSGNCLEQTAQWQPAVEQYLRAIEIDGLAEEFYRRLMACYQKLGQRAKAVEVYQRLRNTLSAAFRIGPSPGANAVYRALLSEDDRA